MSKGTRDRMVDAAIDALRRDGVAGMSFTDLLEASGAARGAIYHHFPGGKSELVAEAVERNARDVSVQLSQLRAGSPESVVKEFTALIRPVVEASAAGSSCAVAAGAMAGSAQRDRDRDRLQRTAGDAIASWIDVLRERLEQSGVEPRGAAELASLLIATLEGAHVLVRAERRIEPFDEAARALEGLVASRYAA
jgi:AcrR family transcriptional regulator